MRPKPKKPLVPLETYATSALEDSMIGKVKNYDKLAADQQQLVNDYMKSQKPQQPPRTITNASAKIAGALSLISGILPGDPIDRFTPVEPEVIYNPNPYGTGSQAIMEAGGKLSKWKAKEMLKDGTANGKKLTKKQKQYFGMVAAGKANFGLEVDGGEPRPNIEGATGSTGRFSDDSQRYSQLSNLVNYSIANGGNPLKNDYGRTFVSQAPQLLGTQGSRDLMDALILYNNNPNNKNLSKEERIRNFYSQKHSNPNVQKYTQAVSQIGYSPVASYWDSPDTGIQAQNSAPLASMPGGGVVTPKTNLPNFTVHGFKQKSTRDVYNKMQEEAPDLHYAMMKLGEKRGFSTIVTKDRLGVGYPFAGSGSAANYNPKSNTTTIYNAKDKGSDEIAKNIVSELAHKVQFDKAPLKSYEGAVRGFLKSLGGVNPYKDKTSMEYEAHREIEPKLYAELFPMLRFDEGYRKDDAYGRKYKAGGKLKMKSGGEVSNTGVFKGPSHKDGGINIAYGGKQVNVEGEETFFTDRQDNLHIMGNMKVPGTKQKFKSVSKAIMEKEQHYDGLVERGSMLVNNADVTDKYDRLKFNTGRIMMKGGDMGKSDLNAKKEDLAAIQNALLSTAEEFNLDPEALSEGKNKKAKAGTFAKAAAGGKYDPGPLYSTLKKQALKRLQAMYPNQKVEIKETGEERDPAIQRGLKGKGASKTSVSLHSLGGARDYLFYVDGKLVNDNKVYKQVLHEPAKALGLSPIGDWDAGHIGAVTEGKEGGGNTFARLLQAHPDLKGKKGYLDTVKHLQKLVDKKEADYQEISAYNQLTGKNIPLTNAAKPNYKAAAAGLPTNGTWFNQNFIPTGTPTTDPRPSKPKDPFRLTDVPLNIKPPTKPSIENPDPQPLDPLRIPEDRDLPSNIKPLDPLQILPELFAFGQNQEEPVPVQKYQPDLFDAYQVSFQDRRNENQSTFNALSRQVGSNPTALGALAAQKYAADSNVGAEEFRTNQGIASQITNQNISLLNDAQGKNLQLADQQMVRQSQARSNTKAQNQVIANSIAGKYLQQSAENQQLALYENLYNFRFDDKNNDGINDKATYYGPDAVFNYGNTALGTTTRTTPYAKTMQELDALNQVKRTRITIPSEAEQEKLDLDLRKKRMETPRFAFPKLFRR